MGRGLTKRMATCEMGRRDKIQSDVTSQKSFFPKSYLNWYTLTTIDFRMLNFWRSNFGIHFRAWLFIFRAHFRYFNTILGLFHLILVKKFCTFKGLYRKISVLMSSNLDWTHLRRWYERLFFIILFNLQMGVKTSIFVP